MDLSSSLMLKEKLIPIFKKTISELFSKLKKDLPSLKYFMSSITKFLLFIFSIICQFYSSTKNLYDFRNSTLF